MRKYEIIIKDLETGETLTKVKTNCIIGAYSQKEGVQAISAINTTGLKIIQTINGLERAIKETKHQIGLDNPFLDLCVEHIMREYGEDNDE